MDFLFLIFTLQMQNYYYEKLKDSLKIMRLKSNEVKTKNSVLLTLVWPSREKKQNLGVNDGFIKCYPLKGGGVAM